MEGLEFVRGQHISIFEGCFLPRAALLGTLNGPLQDIVFRRPDLKKYIPSLIDTDLLVLWDEDKFLLFVSPEKRAHYPTRGMDAKRLSEDRAAGNDLLRNLVGIERIDDHEFSKSVFRELGFAEGFAIAGIYPARDFSAQAQSMKIVVASTIAALVEEWAEERRRAMENARIFLSHKGVNKPLVEKVDRALRLLNLSTWFDKEDLVAGDPLVRGVDRAFAACSAAVFFVSADYADAGVIEKEIDRAIHEAAMRPEGFRLITIVLAQHGGLDSHVPPTLRKEVWKTVDDVEIVPTILRALPAPVQGLIKYAPLK